ncbi:hypothetical protein H0274_04970 [Altererythrobacter sp. CC-YST694]|uniref:hypothetical protein n=1 Tax=Altererythrobacter sp. CC-YST694 TaxID=2755038 RepID=UPI001D021C8D|nr:hypothetical protein [Altererythrobacter sp. CC-YST694]MCB5424601.1 hypothetical protein [Altererythrobacter sp. CC-YST694]
MKKIALLSAALILAACSGSESESQKAAPETPKTPEEAALGTFEVTNADGSKMTSVVSPDRSYTDAIRGEVVEWGTWEIKDGKTCFTPETEGKKPNCYTNGAPAEDGSYTATPDEGDPVKIRKLS